MIKEQSLTKQMIGLMAISYLFSVAIRIIWVYQFYGIDSFMWNNQLMINTNDGYFFASGAKNLIDHSLQYNLRVPGSEYGLVSFTYLLYKITPFSLETIILYMPTFISSLVVIPMILISKLYNQTLWGFFSALLGSITWSFYNRTMTGYYDTDMFAAMATIFILYFLIKSTKELSLSSAFFAGISIIIYPYLYDQGLSIVYAMGIIYGVYMLWFYRDKSIAYSSMILIFLSLLPIKVIPSPQSYLVHAGVVFLVYLYLKRDSLSKKQLQIVALFSFVVFLLLGNVFGLIHGKIFSYTIKGTEDGELHFFAVNQTVREAGKIPFEVFANRTSGSIYGVVIALLGYIVLVAKRRAFILALPLIGIGVFSLWGGLRFTVYAVPVAAMSAVYLFFVIGEYFKEKRVKYLFISFATAILIYPNIIHILQYKVPPVFLKSEVEILDKLKKVSSPKDYTITWWDYGYPIWFYSNTNTLIDGGKHNNDNFIVSKILLSNSFDEVANLSRVAVEKYVELKLGFGAIANKIFTKENIDKKLQSLKSSDYKLPKKSRDIYLYMPNRMLNILSTIDLFSNIDLKTGNKKYNTLYMISKNYKEDADYLYLGNGVALQKQKAALKIGENLLPINSIYTTEYDRDKKLHITHQEFYPNSQIYMIFMKNYHQILVMDKRVFNSAFIQMFVLENYDKNLFEPVILDPLAKVYKIKR